MVSRCSWLLFIILAAVVQLSAFNAIAQTDEQEELKRTQQLSRQNPDAAFLLLRSLYGTAEKNRKPADMAKCLQQMGEICFNQGHYARSLDYYQRAETSLKQQDEPLLLASVLNDIGVLFYYNKQHQMARKYYEQALAIYLKAKDKVGISDAYGNLGQLFEKSKQYDSSFYYQNLALSQYKNPETEVSCARIYENLGSIYEDLEKYKPAFDYFNKAMKLYEKSDNQVSSIVVINNLGDILRKTGKYPEAMAYTRKALQLSFKTNNLYQAGSAYRDISKTFRLQNQLDSAYVNLELSRKYALEVYSREGNQQTAFLQVLYETEKKSQEIFRLDNIRKTNRIIAISVSAVLLLLLILGFVIFSRQRLKIRDEKLIAKKDRAVYETQKELMELDIRNKELEEEHLKQQLELKTRELTSHTLNLIQNNQLLEELREKLQALIKDDKRDQKKALQQIVQQITQSFNNDLHWKEFAAIFEQVHQSFYDNLKKISDDLTSNDMRLLALLKMNLASKDIALLLGISQDSLRISRYRLRKKLDIPTGDNLSNFIQTI